MKIKINLYILFLLLIPALTILDSCGSSKQETISRTYLDYINNSKTAFQEPEQNDSKAVSFFIDGAKYEQQGFYSDAIIEYLDALSLDTNAAIYYALGKNYSQIYKYDRAEEYFKKAILLDSTLLPALEALGTLYIQTYRRSEALKTYQELARIKPSQKNLSNLAFLYEFSDPEKAIEIYEEIRQNNENYLLLLKLSSLYYDLQDTSNYVLRLEEAYQYAKDDTETGGSLISAYIISRQYDKAENVLRESDYRFVTEELEYLYRDVGSILMELRDTNSTSLKREYLKLIDARFYFNWQLQSISGFISAQIQDTAASEMHFKRALAMADSIPEAVLQLANYYMIIDRTKTSIKILNEHKDKFPEDYRFYDLLGMGYFALGDFNKAVGAFKVSIDIENENVDALTQLGIIYDQINILDSSDFYYIRALEFDPYNPLVNNNYAYSLSLRKKNLKKALEMSRIAIDAEKDNPSYLDTYGWILYQMGRFDEAEEYINDAIRTGGATAEVYEHLGDIHIAKEQINEALTVWKKGLELEKDNKNLLQRINQYER